MTADTEERHDDGTGTRGRPRRLRYWPLVALVAVVGLSLVLDLPAFLSAETLETHGRAFREAVDDWPTLSALGYVAGYAAAVALAVPGVVVLAVAGGLLFGTWLGGTLAIAGATTGAIGVFLLARTAVGEAMSARSGPWLDRLREGFQENAWSYLVVLRILPVCPFVVVNVGAAVLGVRLQTYVLATFLGMLPGSFVYAGVGSGLGVVLAEGGKPDPQIMLEPGILVPLLLLAALALLPVAYKWAKRREWQGRGGSIAARDPCAGTSPADGGGCPPGRRHRTPQGDARWRRRRLRSSSSGRDGPRPAARR
jgi:uncharacterized membrane protein YdjX (TVP38/TMEM64 family)